MQRTWVIVVVLFTACKGGDGSNDKPMFGGLGLKPSEAKPTSGSGSAPTPTPGAGSTTTTAAAPAAVTASPAAKQSGGAEIPGMFKLGDVVEAKDKDDTYYEAMVTEVSADGYKILWTFTDNTQFISADRVRAVTPMRVDDPVQGMRGDNRWYDAKVTALNADGTYELAYSDGETGSHVTPDRVHGDRRAKRKRKGAGTAGTTGTSSSSGDSQACPASQYTRCGTQCFDLQNDRYNCGSCGHSCPHGMGLCNSGQCDCTEYDKSANGGSCPN